MSDWDEESPDIQQHIFISTQPSSKWDEEEEDENDIKESWDVLSDEEQPPEPEPEPPVPPKPSVTSTPASSFKKLVIPKETTDEIPDRSETPTQKKLRLQKAVIQSDATNVNDLFSGLTIDEPSTEPEKNVSLPRVESFPTNVKVSKEYLDDLSTNLLTQFQSFEKHGHYVLFLENLVKNLYSRLQIEEIRKMSSILNTLANEKQRKEKDPAKKKKAASKKQVKVTANTYEDENYDDYEDFM